MKFTEPIEVLGITKSQLSTFNFVEGKIRSGEFKFAVPYQHQKNLDFVRVLAAESGWGVMLNVQDHTEWEIYPV